MGLFFPRTFTGSPERIAVSDVSRCCPSEKHFVPFERTLFLLDSGRRVGLSCFLIFSTRIVPEG